LLRERGVGHRVLNAKNHRAEAAIIAQAGRSGAVTVSTNMAGRGVDILLGGKLKPPSAAGPSADGPEYEGAGQDCEANRKRVVAAGGLAVIGTGRHESRRIDDQLRGRSGRQGDPGTAQYFLSLDDSIYRKFGEIVGGAQVLRELRQRLKDHPEDKPVKASEVVSSLEGLRLKVEVENQHARHEVLQYDLVIDNQRRTIFDWRRGLLQADPTAALEAVESIVDRVGDDLTTRVFSAHPAPGRKQYRTLARKAAHRFGVRIDLDTLGPEDRWTPEGAADLITEQVGGKIDEIREVLGGDAFAEAARQVLLSVIDDLWTAHLTTLERVDESVGLRSYAELNPLVEFRREAGTLYGETMREIRLDAVSAVCSITLESLPADDEFEPRTLFPSQSRSRRRTMKR
jgi:preprotein translocase subunit SecA